jgi:hypothetical protein
LLIQPQARKAKKNESRFATDIFLKNSFNLLEMIYSTSFTFSTEGDDKSVQQWVSSRIKKRVT